MSIEYKDDEVLRLHRELAAEKIRADQGWQRYENANQAHIEALKENEALRIQINALDALLVSYEKAFQSST